MENFKSVCFTIVLALTGCVLTHRDINKPDIAEQVLLIGADSQVRWTGPACVQSQEKLDIDLLDSKTVTCSSDVFEVRPGHIELKAHLDSKSYDTSKKLDLKLRLTIFDRQNNKVPLEGNFLGKEKRPYIFSAASFVSSTSSRDVVFVPPFYPLDAGWIPQGATHATIDIEANQSVSLTDIRIIWSKWNGPLADRVNQKAELHEVINEPLKSIAVNSQGPASEQLKTLQDAERNWYPMGPVQIFIQLDPDDVQNDLPSLHALAVADLLRRWHEKNPRISFGVSINPYLNALYRAEPLQFEGNRAAQSVLKMARPFVDRGAEAIILRMDDFAPEEGRGRFDYVLSGDKDKKAFSSLAQAHRAYVDYINAALKASGHSLPLWFVPPWYSLFFSENALTSSHRYLNEFGKALPQNVQIVWTGPTVRSLWIENEAIQSFKSLTIAHQLILWDNTLYARAHKDFWLYQRERLKLCSLIGPYDVKIGDLQLKQSQSATTPWLLLNTGLRALQRIQLETAQVYISDPEKYDPEATLRAVLDLRYGKEVRKEMLEFDRLYWSYIENPEVSVKQSLKKALDKILTHLDDRSSDLGTHLNALFLNLGEHQAAATTTQ